LVYDEILNMKLVDHHAHGVSVKDMNVQRMGDILNESSSSKLGGAVAFQKPVGLNIRRYCAAALDLPAHISIDEYVARRAELGGAESSKILMDDCKLQASFLDTYNRKPSELTDPAEFEAAFGIPAYEVLRIESIFENVAMASGDAATLLDTFAEEMTTLSKNAVGMKSIIAYRTGYAIDNTDPSDSEVTVALDKWLTSRDGDKRLRLGDPILCRRVLWVASVIAKQFNLPIQFHVGIGDDDVDMPGNDPAHFSHYFSEMQGMGVNATLLHCYPHVRSAQWLADIYDNVYYDTGFMWAFGSKEIERVMREAFEVGPFHKQLYSSDAFGLAELYQISAVRFRQFLATMLQEWVSDNYCCKQDALNIARAICSENACNLYNLGDSK
jgi:predicted TIM-barrel fold metal-dependent hydrolase